MAENGGKGGLERRALLQGAWGATLLGVTGCSGDERARLEELGRAARRQGVAQRSLTFEHGVASGDPLPDRVILWTRVTPEGEGPIPVTYEVARDPAFERPVAAGSALAEASADFTIKVDPPLPDDGTTYYYRFAAQGAVSPVGRTRTAARGGTSLRFAVASCSSIYSGYFNAYDRIAERDDLDLVVHCGDYIYDFADEHERYLMPRDEADARLPVGLAGLRRRYAYNRKDPSLRRVHQQHPFAMVWDNHDLALDGSRGDAIRAFHEWTPTRAPEAHRPERIYRHLTFGEVDVFLLDTRHIGRDTPIDPTRPIDGTRNRSILGAEQLDWLTAAVMNARGRHRVFVNQVMLAPFRVFGRPLARNMWDGYEDDRERVLALLARAPRASNLFVTGDAHMTFASRLRHGDRAVAMEVLPTSVSRGNVDEELGAALGSLARAGMSLLPVFNPHFVFTEFTRHGYGVVDLGPREVVAEVWYTPIEERSSEQELGAVLTAAAGTNELRLTRGREASHGSRRAEPAPPEVPLFVRGEALGGSGGSPFDDTRDLPLWPRVAAIVLRGGGRLDGVELHLEDGSVLAHGGQGGRPARLDLAPGDYLTSLEIGVGRKDGGERVFFARVVTRNGATLQAGERPRATRVFEAPLGQAIAGFHGRAGREVDRLGALFGPPPAA